GPNSAAFCEPTALTPIDNQPFEELARGLGGRFTSSADDNVEDIVTGFDQDLLLEAETDPATAGEIRLMLDRFPVGVLIYRLNDLIYANRAFLRWAGYGSLAALNEAGGLDALLIESGSVAFEQGGDKPFALSSGRDGSAPCEARLFLVPWQGDSAFALVTMPAGAVSPTATVPAAAPAADTTPAATADDASPVAPADEASPAAPADEASPAAPADDASPATPADDASPAATAAAEEADELRAILDTATDGVIVLDRELRIASTNRSAQALFGQDAEALAGLLFFDLLAPESVEAAVDYFETLQESGGVLNAGREVIGRERQGGLIPLFMTIGRLGEHSGKL